LKGTIFGQSYQRNEPNFYALGFDRHGLENFQKVCLTGSLLSKCNSESESLELVTLLLPTQAALLKWAVELMSDVVEEEVNKMNARNIAMVFVPNMTYHQVF
jgi:hypothetical protein